LGIRVISAVGRGNILGKQLFGLWVAHGKRGMIFRGHKEFKEFEESKEGTTGGLDRWTLDCVSSLIGFCLKNWLRSPVRGLELLLHGMISVPMPSAVNTSAKRA
jgi:hypothetical protein